MKSILQRHRHTLSQLANHLIFYPAVMFFTLTVYVFATDLHFRHNQTLVTAVAKVTWLGKAEEGQIRIYECTDGTPIDRATIIGHANPCTDSEVSVIPIADSAQQTTQRERKQMGLLYLILVLINALVFSIPKIYDHIKKKDSERSMHQALVGETGKGMGKEKKREQ